MALPEPPFTMGVEEEYLLVDIETGALAATPPEALMEACLAELGKQVTAEFFQAQIEIGTRVCTTIGEVREELMRLRGGIARVAAGFGLAPIAASTHPFGDWRELEYTHKDRYEEMARDLQTVIRRMVICGMHVHVGIDIEDLRIDLMNQARYFLPHLLALSASSPYWQGRDTGLKCYRLAVFDSLPRSGLPEHVESWSEYLRLVSHLTTSGLIEDGSKIWWDLRPSSRYPTLEMRISDVCTEIDDALAIAALYQCLLRMLFRLRLKNQRWRQYPNILIHENRWLAQRHGSEAELVDFGRGSLVPLGELIEELIALVAEDAEALECTAEVEHARTIVARGTSADAQRRCYAEAGGERNHDAAMAAVVAMLRERTVAGTA